MAYESALFFFSIFFRLRRSSITGFSVLKLDGCAFNYTHITFYSCCCCCCCCDNVCHSDIIIFISCKCNCNAYPHHASEEKKTKRIKTPHRMILGWVKYEPFSCSRSMALSSQIAHVKTRSQPASLTI